MKTHRSEWPQVREYKKKGHTYFAVDMRRVGYNGQKWRNLPTLKQAKEFAAELAKKVNATGINSINKLNIDPRIASWEQQLAVYGKTVQEAFDHALKLYAQEQKDKKSPFMGELLTLWVDDKRTNKLRPLRTRSINSIRDKANMFKADFGQTRMAELTQERIESYLATRGESNQYRENLRSYLGQFFNWAMRKGYWDKNPAKPIEIDVQRETPKYFNVDDSIRVMQLAKEENMVAYFALCLFGGVRPEETEKLTWHHIMLDTKEIEIPKDISKTKKKRQWVMSETLYAWLDGLDNKQPLIQSGWRKAKQAVFKAMGNWHQDILRHTFCTFTYANDPDHRLSELSHIMGNSPRIIETFYKGVIRQAEVHKWHNILPNTVK